ncbi:MAG: glycoside hydrolase family 1 protein [Chitinophagales bacterium]|nr:glycoside hydrolase family 1 protein [Chitinophagales bacterium]
MKLSFPKDFIWGTSTAAYQIEKAGEHDWKGFKSTDGSIFDNCSMHDSHRMEDLELICQLSNAYRMSHDWSKLQKAPYAEFDKTVVEAYLMFMQELKNRGIHIMLVLHHFTHPKWFVETGSWEKGDNYLMWVDFAMKSVETFGHLVDTWNTFNEPNVYVSNGYITGLFPPFKKASFLTARKVLKAMEKAHNAMYDFIHQQFPNAMVGISHNTVKFVGEVFPGQILAKLFDWWFMEYCHKHFTKVDFQGLSYYAKMPFRPMPMDYMNHTTQFEKLGKKHDLMWEYEPKGFYEVFHRYHKKNGLPIIITESGVCTHDVNFRIESMKEYMQWIHQAINDGIDIRGYFHWSTIDNHEWNIGLHYRFGLVNVDFNTYQRTMTDAGRFLRQVADDNAVEV